MDTVKKDVEGLKSDIGTIKETITSMLNMMKDYNIAKVNMVKEKVIENAIAINLLLHLIFKDEGKEQAFGDRVKEIQVQLYEEMSKELDFEREKEEEERIAKEKGEDLQFMSGKE